MRRLPANSAIFRPGGRRIIRRGAGGGGPPPDPTTYSADFADGKYTLTADFSDAADEPIFWEIP